MGAITEGLSQRVAAATKAEQLPVRKLASGFVENFEIARDVDGTVVQNCYFRRRHAILPVLDAEAYFGVNYHSFPLQL